MRTDTSILVVDDDTESLELLTGILVAEGYDVRPADSGKLALASAAARLPQLVLLDIRMPELDGLEVCRRLKADVQTRDIPLIFISASGLVEERVQGLALGAVDFIVKPIQPEELLARVRTHLELALLRSDLERRVAERTVALRRAVDQLQTEVEERRRVEQALRENQEVTRLAMQAGRTYAFECNPHTDEVRRSYNCADLLGIAGDVSRELWPDCLERVHPDDRATLEQRITGLTPANDSCECDYRVIGDEGGIVYLHSVIRGLFDSNGRVTRYIGIVADTTRAAHAEAALHESEARFRNMADTAPVMICASGADRRANFFNRAWLDFTGRKLEDELGYGWVEMVHADDRERCLASYTTSFDARKRCHIEYRLRRADGEYRWIVCSGVPRWSDEVFAGYIASCVDITDIKRAQEESFDRQKIESLRLLTGGIAHDFNNLLGGILVEAELAEAQMQEGLSPLEGIGRIRTVATRAAEIVRELMIYSGQDKATLEAVNLSRLVEDMLELLRFSIPKQTSLKVQLEKDVPPVLANTAQMRQVVMNLILNASHALGESDGQISVTTTKITTVENIGQNGVELPEGDYILLRVADSGCGMTEETRGRIFDPFFTTKTGGHGLGLAVVQGIVTSHGGAINVNSTPGRGTIFEALLPCATELAGRPPVLTGAGLQASAGCFGTVLLVEDEDVLRVAIAKVLGRRGYSVLSVGDGQGAVEIFKARAREIHTVVLDITLPGLSGLDVLREIRRIDPLARVILTSAYDRGSAGNAVAGDEAGVSFIRKPYRVDDLVHLLGQAMPAAQSNILGSTQRV